MHSYITLLDSQFILPQSSNGIPAARLIKTNLNYRHTSLTHFVGGGWWWWGGEGTLIKYGM